MIIRVLPARTGLAWIRDGVRLFGSRPISLLASIAVGLLLLYVPAMVPVAGPALAAVLAPIAQLGMIAACRAVDAGQVPGVRVYTQALTDAGRRRDLLILGAINALIVACLVAIGQMAGLDDALKIVTGPNQEQTVQASPGLLAMRIALSAPVAMAMWLAPALVGWNGLPAPKAMFYSFFACWRNRWPLLTFVAGVVGAGSLITVLLAALASAVIADGASATFVMAPLSLALLAVIQCGVFRMYRQIIEDPAAGGTSFG